MVICRKYFDKVNIFSDVFIIIEKNNKSRDLEFQQFLFYIE